MNWILTKKEKLTCSKSVHFQPINIKQESFNSSSLTSSSNYDDSTYKPKNYLNVEKFCHSDREKKSDSPNPDPNAPGMNILQKELEFYLKC